MNNETVQPNRMVRVGVIVPESNTTNEIEFNRLCPSGLSFHFARVPLHKRLDQDAHKGVLVDDLAVAATHLGSCDCNLIAFGCTSDSMKFGDDFLLPVMQEAAGAPALTTASAILSTLNALGVKRIAMASPYTEVTNREEAEFLERAGFDVIAMAGLGLNTTLERIKMMSRVPADEVFELARSVDCEEAEALLICCTDFNTLDVIDKLESSINKPVVTSNVATFSAIVRQLRISAGQTGFGQIIATLSLPN